MTRTLPHSFVPAASALTATSVDDLIRPGLCRAFPLLPEDPNADRSGELLDALAQRRFTAVEIEA